jgi:hypothetical protein
MFWFSMFWAWIIVFLQVNQLFGLDVVYFYFMCCDYGDNDGYRHQHRNT